MSTPSYQDRELALVELYHIMGIIPLTFVYGENIVTYIIAKLINFL